MAIRYLERHRRGGWSLAAAALVAVMFVWAPWAPESPPSPTVASAANAAVFAAGSTPATQAAAPQSPRLLPSVPQPAAPLRGGGATYLQALQFAECETAEHARVEGVLSQAQESYEVDPSDALASIQEEDRRQTERCRSIGPAEYRSIGSMMNEAAAQGDARARLYLLSREVEMWTGRIAADRADGVQGSYPEAARLIEMVEALAQQGDRAAALLAAQVRLDDWLAPADTLRAAAWQLLAEHPEQSQPFSAADLDDIGLITQLTESEAQQVLSTANRLREGSR